MATKIAILIAAVDHDDPTDETFAQEMLEGLVGIQITDRLKFIDTFGVCQIGINDLPAALEYIFGSQQKEAEHGTKQ